MPEKRQLKARPRLEPPGGSGPVLLHSCCAPCSGEVIEAMLESGVKFAVYFYNPNIHPREEYELRKSENIRFAQAHGIEFIDADYDAPRWFEMARGMEWEPERGVRCTACFDFRFERTAEYAHAHGYPVMTSCLAISRLKNFDQVTEAGVRAASRYPGLVYWTFNWRKADGAQRMLDVSRREKFYQQEYCGCVYSLRDTNRAREARGIGKIELGKHYYGTDTEARRPDAPRAAD